MKQLVLSEWLLTQLSINKHPARMPTHRRLYAAIRRAITEQVLPSGARLPSTRELASDLSVSRNTILAAFNQLLDEGYVAAKTGSGTYVTYNQHDGNLIDSFTKNTTPSQPINPPLMQEDFGLSKRGIAATDSQNSQNPPSNPSHEVQPFSPGEDDYSRFPLALWRRLLNRQWRTLDPTLLDSSHAGGYLPLRHAIADYLRVSRAVNLTVEQVLITSGTQQSIDLCARLLSDHNDWAWIENPCYWAARRVLEINGLQLHAIPVDNEGMAPSTADFRVKPRLIYTTPSHQYPKGMVMSYGRRRLLLDYAQNCAAWIIEDDYDSEFRFEGRPIASLQGMDEHGRVLYLGTFSKVMYPGIRLGYLVVPPQLVASFKTGLYELQRPGQVVIQAALADFIEEGHFTSHIRRLRQAYGERRRLLQAALAPIAQVGARLSMVDSGLHLVVEFDAEIDDVSIAELAALQGLRVYPLSNYCVGENPEKGLIIGYAYAATEHITQYGNVLAEVIKNALKDQ
jgi:GntR family transcriptional regulator / MocR family aminotransferase